METLRELQARVASDYARLHLPSWPDPHPDTTSPRDEEYSRVTDPGRYRIVHARARCWAAVLENALQAQTEVVAPVPGSVGEPAAFDGGLRLIPRQPDALPLLLLERDAPTQSGQATLAVLDIAVTRPDIVVERQPDCGCDACDSGSSDLLAAIDAVIRHVVGGPFVVLRGRSWHAEWYPGGGSAGSTGPRTDFRELMDVCRRLADGENVRLPKDTEALVGRSWIR